MTDEKTPPTGTPRDAQRPAALRLVPTISTVHGLCEGIAGQLEAARTDIDDLAVAVGELRKQRAAPEVIHVEGLPNPDELAPPSSKAPSSSAPAPRPSLAVKAGTATVKGGTQVTKWFLVAGGALFWAAQAATWIAKSKPEYSPLAEALSTLAAFVSGRLE